MDAQNNNIIEVPMGNGKEDIKICLYAGNALRIDRHWPSENDGRSEANRRESAVLHHCDKGIKKEIDRLAHSKGHHQIVDVYGLFPY